MNKTKAHGACAFNSVAIRTVRRFFTFFNVECKLIVTCVGTCSFIPLYVCEWISNIKTSTDCWNYVSWTLCIEMANGMIASITRQTNKQVISNSIPILKIIHYTILKDSLCIHDSFSKCSTTLFHFQLVFSSFFCHINTWLLIL